MTSRTLFKRLGVSWPILALALLAGVIAFVYAGILNAPMLPWDDDYNLWKNPFIAVGGWWNLWLQPFYGMYVPVTGSVWAALWKLGDGQAWPFRIVNSAAHFGNACLVYVLITHWLKRTAPHAMAAAAETKKASGKGARAKRAASKALASVTSIAPVWPAALVGAALFALHPLQVGSVAWVSDLRGILSAGFGMLATLTFFRWRGWGGAAGSFALFTLGLLSKPQIAALPLALLIAAWILDPKRLKIEAARILPWFGSSAAAAYITRGAQQAVVEWQTPFWMRPIVMADSYGFYLLKSIYPNPLAVDYGRTPTYLQEDLTRALPTIAAFVVALAGVAWLARRNRVWALALLWFVFLSPTSGIVDFGYQQISTVADHYNYAPMIVLATLLATAMQPLFASARWRLPAGVTAAVAALALAGLSWDRTNAWIGERAFFGDMVEKNPNSYSALIGLTNLLCMGNSRADIEVGLGYAKRATEIRPQDPVSVADYGVCLIRLERYPEVLALEEHMRNPDFVRRMKRHDFATGSLFTSLGGVAFFLGQVDKGFAYACEGAAANSLSEPSKAQVAEIQRQLAAKGDHRTCGTPLGIDGVIARVASMGMTGPAPASENKATK